MNDHDAHLANIARRAAARLAGDFGPALPASVESSLSPASRKRGFNLDPNLAISVASLLMTTLQFALQEYRQMAQSRQLDSARARQELAARLREELGLPARLTPEQRDKIASILAEEVVGSGEPPVVEPRRSPTSGG
jgi:hypothetical protein